MRAIPRVSLCTAALACVLTSGCERKIESAESAVAQAEGYDPDAISPIEESSILALIEPGGEPREVLRHGALASSRRLQLEIRDDKSKLLIKLALSWRGVATGDETLGYLWAVLEANCDRSRPKMEKAGAFSKRLASMFESLRGQATGSGVGLSQVTQTRGTQTSPSLPGLLTTFAVPLPEEAAGVGAVWTRTTRYEELAAQIKKREPQSGADGLSSEYETERSILQMTETERYTLVERQGELLTIDYETRIESDKPELLPTQTGTGRFVVALGDPLAQLGTFDLIVPLPSPGTDGSGAQNHEVREHIELQTLSPP